MSLQFVIDGYNIIKHPQFTQHIVKRTQDSKITLLEFIRVNKLCGSPKNKIIVVFDGYPDSRYLNHQTYIEVIFTREGSADERIRRIVEESNNAKNIVLVSDDKEIRLFAKSYGAKIQGIEEFISGKEKFQKNKKDMLKPELTYSQMHKINQELRRIWLK